MQSLYFTNSVLIKIFFWMFELENKLDKASIPFFTS